MQFNTPYGLADDQSASYFCGLQEGLAIGAVTGGVNSGTGGGQGYTLGKGGIYLTTDSFTLDGVASHKTINKVSLSCTREFSGEVNKVVSLYSAIGQTSFNGEYVVCNLSDGFSFMVGPFRKTNEGNLNTSNTWYLIFYCNGQEMYNSSGISSLENDEWTLTYQTYSLQLLGKEIQIAYSITKKEIMFYHLKNTPYCYFKGRIYRDGEEIYNKITSKTGGYSNVFSSDYLKLFCNPSLFTEFERQVTGCYPVLYNGEVDQSLIIAKFRCTVESNAWIVVREVTQRIGYVMATHVLYNNTYTAFVVVDEGEEYADFVDQYIAEKLGISINTEQ